MRTGSAVEVRKRCYASCVVLGMVLLAGCKAAEHHQISSSRKEVNPMIVMTTSHGTVKIELFADKAPVTVANFLKYVSEEFYDGTIFHRVIADFMIQGGGFTREMTGKATHPPIENEAEADVKNLRGTIAMARTSDINSATAQFFINLKDNDFLNHRDESVRGFGYAVFGKVVEGMDVVDKIGAVATGRSGHYQDVPLEAVVIERVRRIGEGQDPRP